MCANIEVVQNDINNIIKNNKKLNPNIELFKKEKEKEYNDHKILNDELTNKLKNINNKYGSVIHEFND